jgi:hypothetical protein
MEFLGSEKWRRLNDYGIVTVNKIVPKQEDFFNNYKRNLKIARQCSRDNPTPISWRRLAKIVF